MKYIEVSKLDLCTNLFHVTLNQFTADHESPQKKNNGPRLIDPTVCSRINVSKRNRFHRKPMQMFKDALETKSIGMFVFFINTSVILFRTLVNLMIIFNYSRWLEYC